MLVLRRSSITRILIRVLSKLEEDLHSAKSTTSNSNNDSFDWPLGSTREQRVRTLSISFFDTASIPLHQEVFRISPTRTLTLLSKLPQIPCHMSSPYACTYSRINYISTIRPLTESRGGSSGKVLNSYLLPCRLGGKDVGCRNDNAQRTLCGCSRM